METSIKKLLPTCYLYYHKDVKDTHKRTGVPVQLDIDLKRLTKEKAWKAREVLQYNRPTIRGDRQTFGENIKSKM